YKIKYAFIPFYASDGKSGLIFRIKKLKSKSSKKSKFAKKSKHKSGLKDESKIKPVSESNIKPELQSEFESDNISVANEDKSQDKHKENIQNSENLKKSEKIDNKDKPETSRIEKISGYFEKAVDIWEISSKPLKKICKGIHFENIYINFKISDLDAYDCALKYGKICILVYNLLAVFDQIFSLKKKSIDVNCVFNEEKSIYDISFSLRFHIVTFIISALSFLLKYKSQNTEKSGGSNNGKQKRKTDK
ncbi:MAG: DUF2953 domain-containing protein, partial [Oscillospiraceae bacterium]|nr:DUF2953 domain-containing protein [Oscillospiraceae bacterium]